MGDKYEYSNNQTFITASTRQNSYESFISSYNNEITEKRKKELSMMDITFTDISEDSRYLANIMILFSLAGIIFTIFARLHIDSYNTNFWLRICTLISTIFYEISIYRYYRCAWRKEKIRKRVVKHSNLWTGVIWKPWLFESIIGIFHEFPGINETVLEIENPWGFLIFLRLYLIPAHLVTRWHDLDQHQLISLYSNLALGVPSAFRKTVEARPIVSFVVLIFGASLIISYIVNACEGGTFANSAYITAITMELVGYGDRVPKTVCGRVTIGIAAVQGSILVATIITAVINATKLLPDEISMINFMKHGEREFDYNYRAAIVIQRTFRHYLLRQKYSPKYHVRQRNAETSRSSTFAKTANVTTSSIARIKLKLSSYYVTQAIYDFVAAKRVLKQPAINSVHASIIQSASNKLHEIFYWRYNRQDLIVEVTDMVEMLLNTDFNLSMQSKDSSSKEKQTIEHSSSISHLESEFLGVMESEKNRLLDREHLLLKHQDMLNVALTQYTHISEKLDEIMANEKIIAC